MKRFLIVTQVFSPDPAAVGQYFDEAAQAIAGTGAAVTVLTSDRGYDNPDERFSGKEDRDGIQIRRLPLSSFGKASIPVRIFAQLSFLIQCIARGLFSPKLSDLLVSTSPPMAAITAVAIGFFRPRLRVHYWVMDLNPDQAIALGAFRPRHPLVLALDWLNRRILKRADTVVALDRFMRERLIVKLRKERAKKRRQTINKITVLPPWPMDQHIDAVSHVENPFRKEQGWGDKFVVMYSGNHSLVHPLDTLLDAADALQDDARFVFVFIGGGKGKQAIEERIARSEQRGQRLVGSSSQNAGGTTESVARTRQESGDPRSATIPCGHSPEVDQSPESHSYDCRGFGRQAELWRTGSFHTSNIVSLPYQPLDQIKYSLSAADLHIVSLGTNMSGIVHPCKIYGALAIGRPVLALGPKESYLKDILSPTASEQSSNDIPEPWHPQSNSAQSSQPTPSSRGSIGWSIEHGDVQATVAALKAAADQTQKKREAMGQRAREAAIKQFSRKQLLQKFLAALGADPNDG